MAFGTKDATLPLWLVVVFGVVQAGTVAGLVVLYRPVRSGGPPAGRTDRRIGADNTNDRGRYRVHEAGANGKFYAKSTSEGRCQRDRSYKTVRV